MKRVFSILFILTVGLTLYSCKTRASGNTDSGEARLRALAEETGVEWSVVEGIIKQSPIDTTEDGKPAFLIDRRPFFAKSFGSGAFIFEPNRDLGLDSLSFADFVSVDIVFRDAFGEPLYSGDRDLFRYGRSDLLEYSKRGFSSDFYRHFHSLYKGDKGFDPLSVELFFSFCSDNWLSYDEWDSKPAVRQAISCATDFEMASIYEPADDTAILIGYHSFYNIVIIHFFGKELR